MRDDHPTASPRWSASIPASGLVVVLGTGSGDRIADGRLQRARPLPPVDGEMADGFPSPPSRGRRVLVLHGSETMRYAGAASLCGPRMPARRVS